MVLVDQIEGFQIKYTSRTKWWNSLYFFRKILGQVWSEMVVAHWSQGEWMNGWTELIFCILIQSANSGKLRTTLINFFWGGVGGLVKNVHGTLISKCVNEPGWFFACYTYLRELKVIYFNSYWVGLVKYGVSF